MILKPLPRVEPLGRLKVNFVKVYSPQLMMKAHEKNHNDNPELFVDIEGEEIHLGVSAKFRFEPQRESQVKPHIDIYIPITEGAKVLEMVEKLRGDKT